MIRCDIVSLKKFKRLIRRLIVSLLKADSILDKVKIIGFFVGYLIEHLGMFNLSKIPAFKLKLHGQKLMLHPCQREIVGYWEVFLEKCYENNFFLFPSFKDNLTVVDVGANVGMFSLWAASQISNVHIYAFEPNPKIFERLKYNIKANGLVNCVIAECLAICAREGSVYFKQSEATLTSKVVEYSEPGIIKVPVISLDKWVRQQNIESVDFLKIDTEGYEMEVFKGAQEIALNIVRNLVVECHKPNYPAEIKAFLAKYGFRLSVNKGSLLFFSNSEL